MEPEENDSRLKPSNQMRTWALLWSDRAKVGEN
jgi:hypothetical protein